MTATPALGERERIAPDRVRVVRSLDVGPWERFVDDHRDSSIWHTPQMYEVLRRTRRHRPSVWAALDADDAVVGLWTPVEIAAASGPLRMLTSRAVSFAAPLVAPGPQAPEVMGALLSAYRNRGPRMASFTEIRNHVDPGSLATMLAGASFHHERHLNFLLDLTLSEQELWGRIASSARRNVRKAERMGVEIDDTTDRTTLATAYEILRDVYHRIKVPLPHLSLFEASLEILGPLGWFKILTARVQERPIGILMLLLHKGMVTYWYTGTLREFAGHRAGDALVWHSLRTTRAAGCHTFDFGGAGRPDEDYGVRDFKAKYGGRLVDHGRDVWASAPLRLRVSKAGYSLARRFL